jgi:hypothetical protein
MTTSPATSASSQAIVTTFPPIAKLTIRQYDRMIDAGITDYWVADIETKTLMIDRSRKMAGMRAL